MGGQAYRHLPVCVLVEDRLLLIIDDSFGDNIKLSSIGIIHLIKVFVQYKITTLANRMVICNNYYLTNLWQTAVPFLLIWAM